MENCFSNEILQYIFRYDINGCLLTTESYDTEYKENLNISYDLFKTMNGLANNRGGYIICGVSPNDRKLKGLSEEKISFYNTKIDSEEMRGKILSSCQPNMEYKHCMYNIGTAKFVVFYIPESRNKPHIFNQSGDGITQGDIYFRYNDSIKKIQYAELSSIIESKRVKEQDKWMKFLGEIAKIGLDNVLIIDAKNGKMISSDNYEGGIAIDSDILSKFKLIKEGHFNEITGDPTLKLIGNIEFKSDSGCFELSTDTNSILNPNVTHPYRYVDILNKLIEENVRTTDNKLISEGKISYHRIRFYIVNNNLNSGINNVYENNFGQKTFSNKVYNEIKQAFSNMKLVEIENLKQIKKEDK